MSCTVQIEPKSHLGWSVSTCMGRGCPCMIIIVPYPLDIVPHPCVLPLDEYLPEAWWGRGLRQTFCITHNRLLIVWDVVHGANRAQVTSWLVSIHTDPLVWAPHLTCPRWRCIHIHACFFKVIQPRAVKSITSPQNLVPFSNKFHQETFRLPPLSEWMEGLLPQTKIPCRGLLLWK